MVEGKRLLRWYWWAVPPKESETGNEEYHWNIAIVNAPREIGQILTKIRSQIVGNGRQVLEERKIAEGLVGRSNGLHYTLRELVSNYNGVRFKQAYQGDVAWDRGLCTRRTDAGWHDVLLKLEKGEFS